MNALTKYYILFAAATIVTVALRNSAPVRKQETHIASLLAPPLLLIISELDLGIILTVLLTLGLLITADRILMARKRQTVEPKLHPWLIIWLAEAVLPICVHLAFLTRARLERALLLLTGILLASAVLIVFAVLTRIPGQSKPA